MVHCGVAPAHMFLPSAQRLVDATVHRPLTAFWPAGQQMVAPRLSVAHCVFAEQTVIPSAQREAAASTHCPLKALCPMAQQMMDPLLSMVHWDLSPKQMNRLGQVQSPASPASTARWYRSGRKSPGMMSMLAKSSSEATAARNMPRARTRVEKSEGIVKGETTRVIQMI